MRIFKSFFLIALLAISFSLHADNENPTPKFNVTSQITDNNAMVYQLYNLMQAVTTVRITSVDGKTTFFETRIKKHNGYRQKIHMDQLANGRYIFEVEQGTSTKKQVILIRDQKAVLSNISN